MANNPNEISPEEGDAIKKYIEEHGLMSGSKNLFNERSALPISDVGDGALTSCASNRDGDCNHPKCPQILDNEPETSGRSCI